MYYQSQESEGTFLVFRISKCAKCFKLVQNNPITMWPEDISLPGEPHLTPQDLWTIWPGTLPSTATPGGCSTCAPEIRS